MVALSNSGSSEEIVRLLDHIKRRGSKLIAITASNESPLGNYSDITISYGAFDEACPLGLAPSVSTTVMLAVGDALAITVMEMRNFKPEDYATYHPGGALGRQFLKVEEAMTSRSGERLGLARDNLTVSQALAAADKVGRRTGAMLLVDENGILSGLLTDADLRRAFVERKDENIQAAPVSEFMTKDPKRVKLGDLASDQRLGGTVVADQQQRISCQQRCHRQVFVFLVPSVNSELFQNHDMIPPSWIGVSEKMKKETPVVLAISLGSLVVGKEPWMAFTGLRFIPLLPERIPFRCD